MSVIFSLGIDGSREQKSGSADLYDDGFSLKGDNGCVVILIHGLTGTPNELKFLAHYLNKRGYSVICPRLANHGKPLRVLKNTTWQDFYESVRKVVSSDESVSNAKAVFTSGLSMGALLALLLADEFKERIAGVSCLAPTLFYDGWNTPMSKYFLPLAYTPLKHFFYFKEDPPYGVRNEAIQRRVHKYYSKARLDSMENVAQYGYPFFPVTLLHQLHLLVKHLNKKLPSLEVPVQLIQAKDDDMTSIKNSKHIYDRIKSEDKEMIFLYNSYHVISIDQERNLVAGKMEGFFNHIRESLCEKITL